MNEIVEFRINKKFSDLLPPTISGKDLGSVLKVQVNKSASEFDVIKKIADKVESTGNESFFFGWNIVRKYTKREFDNAKLFHLIINTRFEPAGEECGTLYDETAACSICGANRIQISPLTLKKSSIPKKDISRTIAGEVIVSEKFVTVLKKNGLKGALLKPVVFNKSGSNYYQLIASTEVELTKNTIVGINPFDFSGECFASEFSIPGGYYFESVKEIYDCPNGDTIGLNLLSEPYVLNSSAISSNDLLVSKQKIGVNRGLLRPEALYFCSQPFKQMIQDEKLSGFYFEIANVE
jgi:hypothetical protein